MKSQETQNAKTENNLPPVKETPDHLYPQESMKPEPVTQIQKENVITSQDLPDSRVRYGFTLVILASFLFVAAIYYGIINP
ncbi:hypothetical protein NIES2100_38170 [Calothrix sp. NIES-2100]|uniref:hypothetical protein n=1 Tax=Calothrix sp. NIES-2100 TaxID=1954172 RepID=UPI000B621D63|nr:hypothetical protein NIES2100_38170 [Calothrix sp. NIES-2100]